MKETIEKLWDEYLLGECALIETDEERNLTKKIVELHEMADALLEKNQKEAVERYVDTLLDAETFFVKKAFIKGCEFAVSFLLESGNFKR